MRGQAYLRGEALPWSAPAVAGMMEAAGAQLRKLAGLEREVAAYWTAVYFRDALAADPARTWPGMLLHWIRQVRSKTRSALTPANHAPKSAGLVCFALLSSSLSPSVAMMRCGQHVWPDTVCWNHQVWSREAA